MNNTSRTDCIEIDPEVCELCGSRANFRMNVTGPRAERDTLLICNGCLDYFRRAHPEVTIQRRSGEPSRN